MLKIGDVVKVWLGSPRDNSNSHVQKGVRPCVIISNIISENHPLFIVSPITTKGKRNYKRGDSPFVQKINLKYTSYIHYEHHFTVPADHNLKLIYSLNGRELQEMYIKSSYCLGISHVNLMNIKEISSLLVQGDTITIQIKYYVGNPGVYTISLDEYRLLFDSELSEHDIHENLSSLQGLQYLLGGATSI